MSFENPLWGAPKVHGELLKLGIDVAQSTVSTYMVPRQDRPLQTWKTSFAVGVLVRGSKMIQHTLASCRLGRDLGEPDRGFRRFDLAEERPHAAELVVSSVEEGVCARQNRSLRGTEQLLVGASGVARIEAGHFGTGPDKIGFGSSRGNLRDGTKPRGGGGTLHATLS